MIERPGTWGELEPGMLIEDKTGFAWLVTGRKRGWTELTSHLKRKKVLQPRPDDTPVTVLEATEEEALALAKHELGADYLLNFRRHETLERQSKRWIVPAFPTKGRQALDRARAHVEWYHGGYAGKADYAGGFKTLKALTLAHQEMHEQMFMDGPHSHEES